MSDADTRCQNSELAISLADRPLNQGQNAGIPPANINTSEEADCNPSEEVDCASRIRRDSGPLPAEPNLLAHAGNAGKKETKTGECTLSDPGISSWLRDPQIFCGKASRLVELFGPWLSLDVKPALVRLIPTLRIHPGANQARLPRVICERQRAEAISEGPLLVQSRELKTSV